MFVFALWCKAIFAPASGIIDPDFYWHLTSGRWIIEHGTLPTIDAFSWSMPGAPYRPTQWLGQYLLALTYELGGWTATHLLSILLTGLILFFTARTAALYVPPAVAMLITVMCNLVHLVTPLRPQLFSFLCLSILVHLVTKYQVTSRPRYLLLVPIVFALWVNLHGAFVVGFLYLGLLGLSLAWRAFRAKDADMSARRQFTHLLAAGAIALPFTLLNPFGLGAWESVLYVSGLQSSSVIIEWQPVQITTEFGFFLLCTAVAYLTVLSFATDRTDPAVTVLGLFFLLFAALANRQVALAGLVLAPLVARLLASTPQYQAISRRPIAPIRPGHAFLVIFALVLALPFLAIAGHRSFARTLDGLFPVSATDFLVAQRLGNRVLAHPSDSDYMMSKGLPVFIDSRLDFYGDRFFFEWYLAVRAAPGWDSYLATHQPEALLLHRETPMAQAALAGGNWRCIWQDARYVILTKMTDRLDLPSIVPTPLEFMNEANQLVRPYNP
jgi:arginine exporter protein ArgO